MSDEAIDPHYSRALDEIYLLRAALAYEANLMASRKPAPGGPLEAQIARMRGAARGQVGGTYAALSAGWSKKALNSARASTTLTRHSWETQS